MSFENPTITPQAEGEQTLESFEDRAVESGMDLAERESELSPATETGRSWTRAFILTTFLAAGLVGMGSEAEAGLKNPFGKRDGEKAKQEQTAKDEKDKKDLGNKIGGFFKNATKKVESAAKKVSAQASNKLNDIAGYEGKASVDKDGTFKFEDGKAKDTKVQGSNQAKYGSNALTRAADEREAKKSKK